MSATNPLAGLDNPARRWLEKLVRVKAHPEWGAVRVMRWFPGGGGQPEMLRVFSSHLPVPMTVEAAQVEVAESAQAQDKVF